MADSTRKQRVWRCPRNHVITNGCRDMGEYHPDAPHALLFHSREACLQAMVAWVRLVAEHDPTAVGTTSTSPVSVIGAAKEQFPGHRGDGVVKYDWRVEVDDVRVEDGAVVVTYRSWFRPKQQRAQRTYTADGEPAGWVDTWVHIGDWYPWTEAAYRHPSTEGQPDVRTSFRAEPESVTLVWGDAPGEGDDAE